jgi:hypothetical protein
MHTRRIVNIVTILSLVALLFIGSTSYTWNIDKIIGRTVYDDELIGLNVSGMVANDTAIYSENSYLVTQLTLNSNITFKDYGSYIFGDLQQGAASPQTDPASTTTIYVSDNNTLQALNNQSINVVYTSSRYDVFTPTK